MPFILTEGVGSHHHKIILIKGHIQSIDVIPDSKLNRIKLLEFDDDKIYFFKDTLRDLPEPSAWNDNPIRLGMIEFYISDLMEDAPFDTEYCRGTLVFNVPNSSNISQDEKMTRHNFTIQEVDSNRFGGTKACAPITFLDSSNKMIHYQLGDDYYFPLVTFADRTNPLGNCYFSFGKGPEGLLDTLNVKAEQNYILGLDDDPFVDPKAKVFVHKKIIT